MRHRANRKTYLKPKVLSENVFEQAALACGQVKYDDITWETHLKSDRRNCGYSHS